MKNIKIYLISLFFLLVIFIPKSAAGLEFGYHPTSGGTQTYNSNEMDGILATPAQSGSVTKITWYSAAYDSNYYTNTKTGIYAGSLTGAKIGQSDELYINWTTLGWHDWNFTTQPSITASTAYYITAALGTSGKYTKWYYDTATGVGSLDGYVYDGTLPDPMSASATDKKMWIYATYTATGGAAAKANEQIIIFE